MIESNIYLEMILHTNLDLTAEMLYDIAEMQKKKQHFSKNPPSDSPDTAPVL